MAQLVPVSIEIEHEYAYNNICLERNPIIWLIGDTCGMMSVASNSFINLNICIVCVINWYRRNDACAVTTVTLAQDAVN